MVMTMDRPTDFAAPARERRCVTGADPDAPFEPMVGGGDLWAAPDLERIADLMRDEFEEFDRLPEAVRWKALYKPKASKAGGATLAAKTQLTSGALALFARCEAISTFAYNELMLLTNWEAEAAVFHELLKLKWEVDPKTGDGQLVIRRPDFAGFSAEVGRYGKWRKGLAEAETALAQAPLFR